MGAARSRKVSIQRVSIVGTVADKALGAGRLRIGSQRWRRRASPC